jgi:hypothetical protein
VDGKIFGVTATAGYPEDTVAVTPTPGILAAAHDLAGKFDPGNVTRSPVRRGISSAPLEEIGPIQRRGAHAYENLAAARFRSVHLTDLENLGASESSDDRSQHFVVDGICS